MLRFLYLASTIASFILYKTGSISDPRFARIQIALNPRGKFRRVSIRRAAPHQGNRRMQGINVSLTRHLWRRQQERAPEPRPMEHLVARHANADMVTLPCRRRPSADAYSPVH